ncbi:MAG: glycine betaine ABC transporter substrate-binding protein [Dehalococcoidales bacterium]|nr:glycine betaine ABC transporter substrate-binding protein [Dehalococcoidales bacterium]
MLEGMGYSVELSTVSAGVMFEAVATGDQDFMTTAWLPYTHKSYWEARKNNLDRIGTLYEGAVLAIVVPDYVTIDSLAEMKDHAGEFGSRIVGIDPGAGIMEATKNVLMPNYGLGDWELSESSEAAMIAELERSINNQEWIAVTGWAPHWKFAAYDLKMLEDPDETLGGLEEIVIIAREGFREDYPEIVSFLENWKMTSDQLGEVMHMISVDGMAPAVAAAEWVGNNQDVVDSWLS